MKDTLRRFYAHANSVTCPSRCKCVEECYRKIMYNLVSDGLEIVPFSQYYVRGGALYCCGKPIQQIDEIHICTVCGKTNPIT